MMFSAIAGGLLLASPAFAAQTLLINFSNTGTNDITAGEATGLGADLYTNVLTGGGNSPASISLDGVTGSVTYADYYQQYQKAELGQPYATLVGAKQIGATGDQVLIALDLGTWMAEEGYSSYTVKLYYAGRGSDSETELTTGTKEVHFSDGVVNMDDTITVNGHGSTRPTFWSGNGETLSFSGDELNIDMDHLVATGNVGAGISAIEIVGVPEPSSTALLGLGGIALILRRKKN